MAGKNVAALGLPVYSEAAKRLPDSLPAGVKQSQRWCDQVHEYPFSSHFLNLDGQQLHYLDEGQGPVVLLLHGNPTWSYFYRHLVPLLAVDHRVIVPDHIGCGFSDKPQRYPYRLVQHRDNILHLLAHCGVDRYSLVVHDWGGAIGMACATSEPARLERLVLCNTAAFCASRIPLRIRICRWPFLGALLVRGFNAFAGLAPYMATAKPLAPTVRAAFLHPYNSWANRVAIHRFVQDIPLTPSHPGFPLLKQIDDGLARLQGAHIAKLIVWGGRDFCFNDWFYQEWQRRFPEAASQYFPEAGHYLLEDAGGQILPLIQRFFREASA